MTCGYSLNRAIFLFLLILLFLPAAAPGAELSIPAVTAKAGTAFELPVRVDQVDNLAGVKLHLTYDPELLTFDEAEKTRETSSLMHIVNSKKPGTLIIVMAGARGIKGEDIPLLTLRFTVAETVTEKQTTAIEVREAQLMSDALKDLSYTVAFAPVTILPAGEEASSEESELPAASAPVVPEEKTPATPASAPPEAEPSATPEKKTVPAENVLPQKDADDAVPPDSPSETDDPEPSSSTVTPSSTPEAKNSAGEKKTESPENASSPAPPYPVPKLQLRSTRPGPECAPSIHNTLEE